MARNKANLTNALNGTAMHGLNLPGKSDTASIHLFSFNDSLSTLSTALKHSNNTNITLFDLHPFAMKYNLAG
ncbi:hypothetical protein UCRNP2_9040 [Neofusicoccum parvum UCRNP2]|uniref:Uncharacterized protein n=1 Tax=Botryosphaeria parva (strain UCR-NP2) TaxID=1287680 RepID=R1E8X4_BOTPV|nr:hypothetical protein UCRNP2_9040 [Neofusicoccum parvum UCRNP2]